MSIFLFLLLIYQLLIVDKKIFLDHILIDGREALRRIGNS